MPINDLKKGEGVKLDVVGTIVDGGPPGLALTISKLSSCLLSPSERALLALLVEVTFMASFPACSMFICADTSLWSCPSIGSSPHKKYKLETGEQKLCFRKPLKILFWKIWSGFILDGRRGNADRPDLRIGRE